MMHAVLVGVVLLLVVSQLVLAQMSLAGMTLMEQILTATGMARITTAPTTEVPLKMKGSRRMVRAVLVVVAVATAKFPVRLGKAATKDFAAMEAGGASGSKNTPNMLVTPSLAPVSPPFVGVLARKTRRSFMGRIREPQRKESANHKLHKN
jgi:hypothetical protein